MFILWVELIILFYKYILCVHEESNNYFYKLYTEWKRNDVNAE